MDKYEYQVCADQIKSLITEHRFKEAMEIADTIDWRRVKSFSMLCTVSEIYKVTKHYSEAKDILLLAYDRYPDRANVVYALCELAIKLDDIKDSVEFYKEYVRLKPHDTNRYVLLYKIYEAQDVPLEEKISLLEEYKKAEYTEKWAYELALLYHKDGQETKCVETCDELVLWFGEGPYVHKALELKMQHAPLTKEQQRKYDGVYDGPVIDQNESEETVHIYETQSLNAYSNGASPFETAPMESAQQQMASQQDLQQPSNVNTQMDPYQQQAYMANNNQYNNATQQYQQSYQGVNYQQGQYSNPAYQQGQYGQNGYAQGAYGQNQNPAYPYQYQQMDPYQQNGYSQGYGYPQSAYQQPSNYGMADGRTEDIQIQPVSTDKYSTINLQEELARNMEELYAKEREDVAAPYYGATSQLYEPSQEQFMNQINQAGSTLETQEQVVMPVYEAPQEQEIEAQISPEEPIETPMVESAPNPVPDDGMVVIQPSEDSLIAQEEEVREDVRMDNLPVYNEEPATSRVPKELEDKVRIGLDGQMTMALPEPEVIEKQITGQIDISDFMADWEAKKRSAEEQRKAQIKAKSMSQTSDIMSQLAGVIPGLEDINSQVQKAEHEVIQQEIEKKPSEEIIRSDEKSVVTKTTIASPTFDRQANVKRTESGAKINGPMASSITGEIPDILPSAAAVAGVATVAKVADTVANEVQDVAEVVEEAASEVITQPVKEDKSKKPIVIPESIRKKKPEEEAEPIIPKMPEMPEMAVDYGEAEEIPEVDQPELPEEEDDRDVKHQEPDADKVAVAIDTGEIPPLAYEKTNTEELPEAEEYREEPVEDNISTEEDEKDGTNSIVYPYDVDDYGEIEDLEDLEQPEDVDDMLKTRPMPIDEIEALEEGDYRSERESEVKKDNRPSYMAPDIKAKRDFEDVEYDIFGRFDGIENLKAQIIDTIDDMSMEARHGNVIVMGSELFDRKALSIDIVRAIRVIDSSFSGAVAKISGEALNKKNIPSTISKLQNGALVVENAGGLDPITMNAITEALLESDGSILVVLEDEREPLELLLNGCPETRMVFNARINIQDFNDDDLVAFAKGYAYEEGYSIDEMGTLALHTRIAEMQSLDHKVSVDEAIEIVDAAIKHVDRKNMGHFMDVLLSKRYDNNNCIVLREKDFLL